MIQKKKLKRFDTDVMERLLLIMYESGREKKTNLARNSNMGYDSCVLYLEYLELLDFVKKHNDGKHDMYDLTASGINFCKRRYSDLIPSAKINTDSLLV